MTKESRCEAQVTVEINDEHGRALPPEVKGCTRPAKVMVTREFSGISQLLCRQHANRFKRLRDRREEAVTITEAVEHA